MRAMIYIGGKGIMKFRDIERMILDDGWYYKNNVTMSIPSIVGAYGVERRLVEKWDKAERTNLENTAGYLRGVLDSMD